MPEADIYERGLGSWPYRRSIHRVLAEVKRLAPKSSRLLDIMCGTGYLLGEIRKLRDDLQLTGVDIEDRYIEHGRASYQGIDFLVGDVVNWESGEPFDTVLCTGALHHVSYEEQPLAVENIASLLKPGGVAIISDSYVGDYENEDERRRKAAELGCEYYFATRANGAPADVLAATLDILIHDVRMEEFKTSLNRRLPVLKRHFSRVETFTAWPDVGGTYGDYYHLCRAA